MAVYRVLRPTFIQGALREPGEVLHHLPDDLEGNPDHWPATGPHLERVDVPSRQLPPPQPPRARAAPTRAKAKAAVPPAVAPAPVSETPSEDKEKAAS